MWLCDGKAPEGWRSPGRWRELLWPSYTRSVLDCGSPLPLWGGDEQMWVDRQKRAPPGGWDQPDDFAEGGFVILGGGGFGNFFTPGGLHGFKTRGWLAQTQIKLARRRFGQIMKNH